MLTEIEWKSERERERSRARLWREDAVEDREGVFIGRVTKWDLSEKTTCYK